MCQRNSINHLKGCTLSHHIMPVLFQWFTDLITPCAFFHLSTCPEFGSLLYNVVSFAKINSPVTGTEG